MFAKDFRLSAMGKWDPNDFEDALGKKVQWGIVSGRPFSWKEEISAQVCKLAKGKRVDMKAIAEDIKKKMVEANPDAEEVEVPISSVEEQILEMVSADRARNEKFCYIFDDWLHKSFADFVNAIHLEFGLPSFGIKCEVSYQKTVDDRWCQANETDAVPEETRAELDEQAKTAEENYDHMRSIFEEAMIADKLFIVGADSMAATTNRLKGIFSAKVILVNHEKRLEVDTACSNLSIKYNMLYLSVYQLIKQNIQQCTKIGKALAATKKPKNLNDNAKGVDGIEDEFDEAQFSAAHFDQKLVMQMLSQTIVEKRTTQKYILLEGFCNNKKLEEDKDKFANRVMDELFTVEKCLGEIAGVIALNSKLEEEDFVSDKFEEFPEEPVE